MDDPTLSTQSAPLTPSSNVPSLLSNSSLHLDNLPSRTTRINRLLNSSYNRSPSRTIYSDRFIPSRSGSNFALFDISYSPTSAEGKEDGSGTYNSLLSAALFGPDTPDKKDSSEVSACRNIFRYKTETKWPTHSLSPFGLDESVPGISHSPVKAPRKVPKSPYKVLDAPALQDVCLLPVVFICGMLVVVVSQSCVIWGLMIVFVQFVVVPVTVNRAH